ncbi:MAG: carboxymuconolactone decarboxylase family protein [Kiritimatiellae bacterium]|nr:carboxymuconolactone decarboxylase family protein [Kiritimatiellia bacterium]
MDEKVKELIAVGASVSAHCQPCLRYHVAKAQELGIAEDAIREAIAVGHLVEKGAMSAMRQFAAEVFEGGASQANGCCADVKSKGKNCCG